MIQGVKSHLSCKLIVLLSLNDVIISNHQLFIYRVILWDAREEERGSFILVFGVRKREVCKNKKTCIFLSPCFSFLSLQLRIKIRRRGYKMEFDSALTPRGTPNL